MSHVLRWVLVVLLVGHGLIHLLGAAKGFGWAAVSQLKEPIGPGGGALWLLAAMLVLAAAALLATGAPTWWWAVALLAALASQIAIVTSWSDARYGTVANLILLLAAAYGFAAFGPGAAERLHRDPRPRDGAVRFRSERDDGAGDLVAADARIAHIGVLSEIDVQIACAQARRVNPDQGLARSRFGPFPVLEPEAEGSVEDGGAHQAASSRITRPLGSMSIHSPGKRRIDRGTVAPRAFASSRWRWNSSTSASGVM